MLTYTEIENLLSYFINLIEKDGLATKRREILNTNSDYFVSYNEQTETITYRYVAPQTEDTDAFEVNETWVFPDILSDEVFREKEYLSGKIINLITYTQYLKKDELLDQIAKRLESIINSANSNTLVQKYPFISEALNEILLFITKDYINELPASEMLFVKKNRNTTVLLFTLLKDAGLLPRHSDADIVRFISARVSYYDDVSKKYKRIVDTKQLISQFRRSELKNTSNTLQELQDLLYNTSLQTTKK